MEKRNKYKRRYNVADERQENIDNYDFPLRMQRYTTDWQLNEDIRLLMGTDPTLLMRLSAQFMGRRECSKQNGHSSNAADEIVHSTYATARFFIENGYSCSDIDEVTSKQNVLSSDATDEVVPSFSATKELIQSKWVLV